MRILKTFKETYADGPGIRYSIYVAGCKHYCKGCHNPESWNFNQGHEMDDAFIQRVKREIQANPLITGITISGGDPMWSADGLLILLKELSVLGKDIWVFTGFTLEEILCGADSNQMACLRYIDTLVDGRFMLECRETTGFRGSSNQRYLKVKNMLHEIHKREAR